MTSYMNTRTPDLTPKQSHLWRLEEMDNAVNSAKWRLDTLNAKHPTDIKAAYHMILEAGKRLARAKVAL